jgi:predicted nicotinamide N-methyase
MNVKTSVLHPSPLENGTLLAPVSCLTNLPEDAALQRLSATYDIVEMDLIVCATSFHMLKVRDTNELIDAIAPSAFAEDERFPYWAEIWTSSLDLACWCLEGSSIQGKRVLELGCGLGLAGIAAAKAGAFVTFSDYEPDALTFARCNAMKNLPAETFSRNVEFVQLDWRALHSLEKFDVIIAADVVYERRNFFPLMNVLITCLAQEGFAVFTEPGRAIGELFFTLLKEEDFLLEETRHHVQLNGTAHEVKRVIIRSRESERFSPVPQMFP